MAATLEFKFFSPRIFWRPHPFLQFGCFFITVDITSFCNFIPKPSLWPALGISCNLFFFSTGMRIMREKICLATVHLTMLFSSYYSHVD